MEKKVNRFSAFRILLFLLAAFPLLMACQGGKVAHDRKQRQPESVSLHFDAGGKFRIAQFTDIHYTGGEPEKCAAAERVIRHVLETEHPHLAVLTGDIVIAPQEAGWKAVMTLFSEAQVPVAVVLGNHDDEAEWTREEIFRYLSTFPGFVGRRGPASLSGVGNYILEIYRKGVPSIFMTSLTSTSSSKKTSSTATGQPSVTPSSNQTGIPSALLYFLDSNAYATDTAASYYDWIKFDQIAWYREQSRQFTASNSGNPFPALAFFHIPLPEYAEVVAGKKFAGVAHEEVCAPGINTGLLASFVEMKDIMGTFVGHDHVNNFIGVYKGVALAYGQKTGFSSYGDLDKGARIIELQKGKRSFTTWIRTEKGVSCHFDFTNH